MSNLITRCPKCATAFNVTEAHLNTANGSVRCGSCLNVFNGRKNLSNLSKTSPINAFTDDDDMLISDDFLIGEDPFEDEQDTQAIAKSNIKKFLKESVADTEDEDESWALKLLEDESEDEGTETLIQDAEVEIVTQDIKPQQPAPKITNTQATIAANTKTNEAPTEANPAATIIAARNPSSSIALDIPAATPVINTPSNNATATKTTTPVAQPAAESVIAIKKKPAPTKPATPLAQTENTKESSPQRTLPSSKAKPIELPIEPPIKAEEKSIEPEKVSAITATLPLTNADSTDAEPKPATPSVEPIAHTNDAPITTNITPDVIAPEPTQETEPTSAKELTSGALKAEAYAASKSLEPEPDVTINEQDIADLAKELAAPSNNEVAPASEIVPNTGAKTNHSLLHSIEAEALEFSFTNKKTRWKTRGLWGALAVLAAVALGAQVAWMKFDQLSLKDPYREYYQLACHYLGCTLPQQRDLSKIRTTNLLVRTHPSTEGALLVDVVLQNTAYFEQPFPKLVMVFSNIKDKVIASRAFEPSEYLGGDLTDASLMPSQKAIHISLELVDPGAGAVSYKITVAQ